MIRVTLVGLNIYLFVLVNSLPVHKNQIFMRTGAWTEG